MTCSQGACCAWFTTAICGFGSVIMLIFGSIGMAERSGLCSAQCDITSGKGVSTFRSYECVVVHYILGPQGEEQPYCDVTEMGPFCTIGCQCWGSATCVDNTSSFTHAPLLLYTTSFKYPYTSECDQVPEGFILEQCRNNCKAYQISLRGYQRDCWLSPRLGGFYLGYGLEQVRDLLLVIFGSIGIFIIPIGIVIYLVMIRKPSVVMVVVPPYLVTQRDMGLSEELPEGPPPPRTPPSPSRN